MQTIRVTDVGCIDCLPWSPVCLVAQAAFRQSTFRKLLLEHKNLASSRGEMASTAWIALNGACLGLLIGSPLRGNFVSVLMDLSALKSTKPLPPLLAEWGCDEELWSKIKQIFPIMK